MGIDSRRQGQGQASVETKTGFSLLALCGSRLGSCVRHFGFRLKPVIQRVSVYSSALLVQLVSAVADLFFELNASLCSLLRRSEWNWPGFHGEFLLWLDHLWLDYAPSCLWKTRALIPWVICHKLNTGQLRRFSFRLNGDCTLTQRWPATVRA